jgi:hypothetical protein
LFVPLVQRLGYDFPEGESVDIMQLRKTAISGATMGRDERWVSMLSSNIIMDNLGQVSLENFKLALRIT